MEPSFKMISFFITVLLTGLSAGLFFAWEISVIPGTKRIASYPYVQTMQAINQAIVNPTFLLVFLGPVFLQIMSAFQFWQTPLFGWILAAILLYAVGTVGVTIWGNVPLNDALDGINLQQFNQRELIPIRRDYELPWNRWHKLRTACALLAYLLLQVAVFLPHK